MTALQYLLRMLITVVMSPAVQETLTATGHAAIRAGTAQIVREVQNRTVKQRAIRTVK